MKLDLNKLHAHFTGKAGGRQSGRSVALCAQVLGTLSFMQHGQFCVVVVHDLCMLPYIYHLLADVAQAMGMTIKRADKIRWQLHFEGLPAFVKVIPKERATREYLQPYGDKIAVFKDVY